jgi:tetratricopeptide (TPR) repeat protein
MPSHFNVIPASWKYPGHRVLPLLKQRSTHPPRQSAPLGFDGFGFGGLNRRGGSLQGLTIALLLGTTIGVIPLGGPIKVMAQPSTPGSPPIAPPASTLPQSAEGWLNTGLNAIQQGQLPAAIEAFQTALQLNPQLVPARYNLGLALRQSGNLTGAIEAFSQTTQIDPNFALAFSNLGAAFLENNQFEQAQTALARAIELDPQLSIAYYNLGLVYEKTEQWPLAESAFLQTLQRQPNSSQAFYHLGIIYAQQAAQSSDPQVVQRFLNRAQSSYLQAVLLNPQYMEAFYRLGSLNYDRENYLAAIENFRQAANLNPNYADAYYAAALSFVKLNQVSDALTLFSHALAIYQSQNRLDWVQRTQQQIDRLNR